MAETPVWPPTIPRGTPIPKPSASARKMLKKQARGKLQTQERDNKTEAKKRDGYRCRFPLCGCKKLGLVLEASHWRQHKGMGGDPQGLRSDVPDLITVCPHRHRDGVIAIDKGTLEVRPVNKRQGASGCVEWWMDGAAFMGDHQRTHWVLLAREIRIGHYAPMSLQAIEVLHGLQQMLR